MIKLTQIHSEGTFILPKGELVQTIVVTESGGNDVLGGIRFGFSQGLDDFIGSVPVGANSTMPFAINSQFVDLNNDTTIYYDSVQDWNGALVDVYVLTQNILG